MKKTKKKENTIPSISTQPPVFSKTPASQINNVFLILLIIVTIFSFYLYLKVRRLEQKIIAGTAVNQGQQASSPLTVDNLKKYARQLGLNTNKFNKCLDSDAKKNLVSADLNYGTSLGVQGTPGFFINGRFLAGAFPYEFFKEIIDREIAGTGSSKCSDYSQNLQKYCQDPQNKSFDPLAKKVDVSNSPSEGANNPKVTLVEFSDFQCPYCLKAYPTVKKILQDYKNEVRFYYKQFPLTNIHPFAQKAAEASLCAQDQGKFWQYHNKLFETDLQAAGGT